LGSSVAAAVLVFFCSGDLFSGFDFIPLRRRTREREEVVDMDAVAWRMVANSVPAVASSSSGARAAAVASQQQQRSSSAAAATVVSSNVSIVKRQFLAGSCSSSSSYRYNAVAAAVRERMTSTGSIDETAKRATVVMKTEGAAVGYASALAELAQGKDALETVNKDVERLADLLNNEELYDFLISPVVEDEKKKSILKTLAEDAGFTTDTLSFLYLLVDKKRMLLIKDITKEFETIFNESTDTQLATVTSAVKIEQSQLSLIAKKIQSMSQAKNVRIKNVVDPSLIAGFLVKFGKDGSRFIDMSVKGQLDKLASQFATAENTGVF
jgi:F-type H+-transporting ATPase subunit delta